VVRYLATRIAVMYRGKIVEVGATEQLVANPAHPYTRSLLEATPEMEAAVSNQQSAFSP
jgi:ABC-type oligopeptide transport system ATPase subunit